MDRDILVFVVVLAIIGGLLGMTLQFTVAGFCTLYHHLLVAVIEVVLIWYVIRLYRKSRMEYFGEQGQ